MARITIEDCLEKVDNKFILVRVAAQRSYQLMQGALPFIDNKDLNKELVLALREIAAGKVTATESEEDRSPFEPKLF